MRDRLDPAFTLDRNRGHQGVRAGARCGVVVDVDEVDLAREPELARDREHRVVGAALGRVELDAVHPFALAQLARQLGLVGPVEARLDELALDDVQRSAGLSLLLDRRGDRGDLERRRPAAAADQARAELPRVRRELGEVLGRGVRVDDAAAAQAREADVRQHGQRWAAVSSHRLQGCQCGVQACAVVRPDRGQLERPQPLRRLGRGDAGERLGALVEGQRRHDRQARDAAHGLDRRLELVEVVEGLDHEQVDPSAVEQRGLLREELAPLTGRDGQVAERADRARDEDVAAGDLAGLARELHAGAVDPLELVLEVELRQLAPVGAEGVRLDQVGPGPDEARVQRHDALGSAQVGLFRAAQPRYGARHEHAHAAVCDDDRALRETVFEAAVHTV